MSRVRGLVVAMAAGLLSRAAVAQTAAGTQPLEAPAAQPTVEAKKKKSAPAAPATPADVAREWGLLGQWAKDCNSQPGISNPWTGYTVNDKGQLQTFSSAASSGVVLANITDVRVTDGKQLEVTFTDPIRGKVRKRTVALEGGKLRIMTSYDGGSAPIVLNGLVAKTKKPTWALSRCKDGNT